jgi:GNAT superfamily N-acetyltransferase
VRVESYPEAAVPTALSAQAAALRALAWPGEGPPGAGAIHDPALRPISMLLVRDGTVLAALDVLTKDLDHGGETYVASGLSTVVTGQAWQRRGHGRHLVATARDAIRAAGADLGIFTCDRPLRAFYESAGWRLLAGAVLIGGTPANPLPSDQFDKVTMGDFFSAKAVRNAVSFTGCRIGLYPGDIDKLW